MITVQSFLGLVPRSMAACLYTFDTFDRRFLCHLLRDIALTMHQEAKDIGQIVPPMQRPSPGAAFCSTHQRSSIIVNASRIEY